MQFAHKLVGIVGLLSLILFIKPVSSEVISQEQDMELGVNYEDYDLGNGNHQRIIYSYPIAMKDETGKLKRVEDVISVTKESKKGTKVINIEWLGKKVSFTPYYEKDGIKEINVPMSANIKTEIIKQKGSYKFGSIYQGIISTDAIGYDIEVENTKCYSKGIILICGEGESAIKINFMDLNESGVSLEEIELNNNNLKVNKVGWKDLDPTVELSGTSNTEDTQIWEGRKQDYGSYALITIGNKSTSANADVKGLIRFNSFGITEGSIISEANLTLYGNAGSASYISNSTVYELLHNWTEGTGTGQSQSTTYNGSSWYDRHYQIPTGWDGNTPFNNLDADWEAEGLLGWNGTSGDKNNTFETTRILGDIDDIRINFTITNLVDKWINDKVNHPNYGLVIEVNDTKSTVNYKYFEPSEEGVANKRPKLYISYTEPLITCQITDEWVIDLSENCVFDGETWINNTLPITYIGTGSVIFNNCDIETDMENSTGITGSAHIMKKGGTSFLIK